MKENEKPVRPDDRIERVLFQIAWDGSLGFYFDKHLKSEQLMMLHTALTFAKEHCYDLVLEAKMEEQDD